MILLAINSPYNILLQFILVMMLNKYYKLKYGKLLTIIALCICNGPSILKLVKHIITGCTKYAQNVNRLSGKNNSQLNKVLRGPP